VYKRQEIIILNQDYLTLDKAFQVSQVMRFSICWQALKLLLKL